MIYALIITRLLLMKCFYSWFEAEEIHSNVDVRGGWEIGRWCWPATVGGLFTHDA